MQFESLPSACEPHYRLSSLRLGPFRWPVHLGCTPGERANAQVVGFELQLGFPAPPRGCLTDRLEDTVCYAGLCEEIRKVCERREYALIEKLGWDVFEALKKALPPKTHLSLEVIKAKPPVEGLQGDARFQLSDPPEPA